MASLFTQPTASQLLGQAFQQAQQQGVPPSQIQQATRQVFGQPPQAQQQMQQQAPMNLLDFLRSGVNWNQISKEFQNLGGKQ